jgi:hypothetical protein
VNFILSIMRQSRALIAAAAAAGPTMAQRPETQSICDYYTTALLKENSAENQATLLTLVVNTVVIGNCQSSILSFSCGLPSINDQYEQTLSLMSVSRCPVSLLLACTMAQKSTSYHILMAVSLLATGVAIKVSL